jgi:Na+-transporting methylmalonyl-CoA/oxaloacetate decarboxylase beta subunit
MYPLKYTNSDLHNTPGCHEFHPRSGTMPRLMETIQTVVTLATGLVRVSINRNYDSFTYKNIKKTKIRIFVLGVFAFCWAPFTILTILKAYFISESRIVTILGSYFAALGLLNSGYLYYIRFYYRQL